MYTTRLFSRVLAGILASSFALGGTVARAEPTLNASSFDNFAESANRVLEYIQQSDDYSINDRGIVAAELQALIVAPALMDFAENPDKTPAQIKADALKNLTPLDGLTARELIKQIAGQQQARAERQAAEFEKEATEGEQQAHALLEQLRAKSATPTAAYVDLIGEPVKDPGYGEDTVLAVRVVHNPQIKGEVSIVTYNSRFDDVVAISDNVPVDEVLGEWLQAFLDEGYTAPPYREGSKYSVAALVDIVAFEPQFKEWEKIANDAPTPKFLILSDGRPVDFDEGLSAADKAEKRIPAFSWNGSEAAIAVFEPGGNSPTCTWYSSDFFSVAKQLLKAVTGLQKVAQSTIEKEVAAKQASESSIANRFMVSAASSAAPNAPLGGEEGSLQSATINYTAKISADDLLNSKGVFLPDVPNIQGRDILLQERFNYHQRGMRDPEDTNEGLYEEGKETMRKHFEGKVARLADGGDPMPLLSSEPVVDVTLTENEIIVKPAE